MANVKLVGANNATKNEGKTSTTLKLTIPDEANLIIDSEVGGNADGRSPFYEPNSHNRFGANNEKFNVGYTTSVNVTWRGEYVEKKKISIVGVNSLKVGATANLKGMIATTEPVDVSTNTTSISNTDITTRAESQWESSNESVIKVEEHTGIVTAKKTGTAEIKVKWTKGPYTLMAMTKISVSQNGGGTGPISPSGGACEPTIHSPSPAAKPITTAMDPKVTGSILGDDASNGRHFNAQTAIPTSEYLYSQVRALSYLYQHTFANMRGTIDYRCRVDLNYHLIWKEKQDPIPGADGKPIPQPDKDMSMIVPKTYEFNLTPRSYAYWQMEQLDIYGIEQAELHNYALPGGSVTLFPQGYNTPSVDFVYSNEVDEHVFPKASGTINYTPLVIDGGNVKPSVPDDTSKLIGLAEAQTKEPDVKNDYFSFNGQTIMDSTTVSSSGPDPGSIPPASLIGDATLYQDHQLVSSHLLNQANNLSTGIIKYNLLSEQINGGGDKEYAIEGINSVTVHTPVVNDSSVSDDTAHNQKTIPLANRSAFVLDRPFSIHIPTTGKHTDYSGYGNRDYAKYTRMKQVRFPFDVYTEGKRSYITKGNWIDIPVEEQTSNFFMPVWVDEGNYTVEFRSVAENAPNSFNAEQNANLSLLNHAASDTADVEVIGRLYDFHITDVGDYLWENVFRTQTGRSMSTGNSYWVGADGIDGDARGNLFPYMLPIRQGSHPFIGFKNIAIKTGYHFKFDVKTKGNMFDVADHIRITPRFFYMSEDGKTRIPVDLYYRSRDQNFVRIGSPADVVQRYVILNDRLRNVPSQELNDTALYEYDHNFHFGQIGNISRNLYVSQYANVLTRKKTPVGKFSVLELPSSIRTLVGPKDSIPNNVEIDRASASIQKWYGEYSLPSDLYGVPSGTNLAEYGRTHQGLTDKSPIFLKKGYFVVNFNVETLEGGNKQTPRLQYIHAYHMNQWLLEGFQREFIDPYGNTFHLQDGDVVFYQTDKSSRGDFLATITH
ncbi:hypothetical protein J2Z69_000358 [Paenibacillus shirakamiensis]|uniref:DUF5704 domain-containing protein n=1 Tax=Paenibacillus shirakamiensis TaxID=1265935 RepID=A0ABS4JC93_9BACL|nr:DUF5704 domain-containing protein [Paenibacillus shirakamiensis]MBP1999339.1 hypothetical protein [Paenibacillus shirakamiensis]